MYGISLILFEIALLYVLGISCSYFENRRITIAYNLIIGKQIKLHDEPLEPLQGTAYLGSLQPEFSNTDMFFGNSCKKSDLS